MDEDIILDAKVGQFAVTKMASGELHATRIAEIYPPNTEGQVFCGRTIESAPYQRIHLEGLALVGSSAVQRIIDTEVECKLFMAEEALKRTIAELEMEKAAHVRTREKLATIRQTLRSLL